MAKNIFTTNFIYNKRQKRNVFFILNTFFWIGILLREFISYHYYLNDGRFIFQITVISIGFLYTFVFRILFIRLLSSISSLLRLFILYFLSLKIVAVIWYLSDLGVSYLIAKQIYHFNYFANLSFHDAFISFSFFYIVTYVIWGAVYFIFFIYEQLIKQYLKAKEASELANRNKLQILQSQLNPHFLFNSLNALRGLIFENKNKAAELVTDLSDFLRYNLDKSDIFFTNFMQEIEVIKNYLSIEQKRFEEDLSISYNIDNRCNNFIMLSNILLPLIDNAIKHGIKTSHVPLKIEITAYIKDDLLNIHIKNSGNWIENYTGRKGKGLTNVQERLQKMYKNHTFEIYKDEQDVEIKITIPKLDEKTMAVYNN